MERQQLLSCIHPSSNVYFGGQAIDELRHTLLQTTMELEQTRMLAQEQLNTKDDHIMHLRDLLNKAVKEKDEAQERYKKLITGEEQEHNIINGFTSSDGEESIVSSFDTPRQTELEFPEGKLPEKGKLLKAVLDSGPLLQTLLLAGQLPQWCHPPPQLEFFEIPPVVVSEGISLSQNSCGNALNRKRVHCDESNAERETKNQRLLFP